MKTDARIRYTKTMLKKSLLQLLKEKPIGKITIKELCGAAEINRATFYSHYPDCRALLKSIEDDFLAEFKRSGKLDEVSDAEQIVSTIYDTIEENIELCNVLIFDVQSPALINRMIDVAYDESIDHWHQMMPKLSQTELDMLFKFLATGLGSVIYTNFKTCDREKLIRFMSEMVRSTLTPYQCLQHT